MPLCCEIERYPMDDDESWAWRKVQCRRLLMLHVAAALPDVLINQQVRISSEEQELEPDRLRPRKTRYRVSVWL